MKSNNEINSVMSIAFRDISNYLREKNKMPQGFGNDIWQSTPIKMNNKKTMTTEQKEKLMLADDLTAYINEKHTQEECIGFIDGYNAALTKLKLFSIQDVRESYTQKDIDNAYKKGYNKGFGAIGM